jgi:penicillin amidase
VKPLRHFLKILLLLILGVVAIGATLTWILLQRSLPPLDGNIAVASLTGSVTIERDSHGVPTITASNRSDLAFATGFAHGQDRFFQMDLTRRKAAGELAEIFGELAVATDKRMRWHRFRSRAGVVLQKSSRDEIDVLNAYAAGVNAGLASLRSRPFEYFLLRETPRPWLPEDSLLVAYAMFQNLNEGLELRDVQRGYAERALPRPVFEWLYPAGTRWDAPVVGPASSVGKMPGPELFRLDTGVRSQTIVPEQIPQDARMAGSNGWAVAGYLSRNGRAIVANDMHLGLAVPNVFYRARLVQTGEKPRDIAGVTLPGTPVMVTGSNRHVAWAFTNSYGDWSDAVIVRPGTAPSTYRTADGDVPFEEFHETIVVRGAPDETLLIRETRWGPMLENVTWPDGGIAISWIGHKPEAVNMRHLGLETATTVDEAMDVANQLGMPPQNFVCGDIEGNIGWTIAGRIPQRSAYDPGLPADWGTLGGGWMGWLPAKDYPRLENPRSGRIWTANARVVDGDALRKIGDGGYDLGARATQIRDDLFARDLFDAKDMLAIQLDDRALFLSRWRDLLLSVLNEGAVRDSTQRQLYRQLAADWQPRASADSAGYRLVRAFRVQVRTMVFEMLVQPIRDSYDGTVELAVSNQFEGPLWSLVNEQPLHLLSRNFVSWQALLLQAIDRNIRQFEQEYANGLEYRSWGEFNTAAIRHPLSRSVDALSRWLDMPREPLDGDSNMPRVMSPDFGASERFAVSPGDEENGYLHMPTGQSGHPLSEYYRAGHDDWVHGRATPFFPGATAHVLNLRSAQH